MSHFQLLILVTFNLIITNASSNLVACPCFLDTYISGHKTVCSEVDLSKPNVCKVTFSYRPINKINFTEFNQGIYIMFFFLFRQL